MRSMKAAEEEAGVEEEAVAEEAGVEEEAVVMPS
jgi:hypothetical protein